MPSSHHPTARRGWGRGAAAWPASAPEPASDFFFFFFPPALITEFPYHQFPASQHLTEKAVATVLAAAIREHQLRPGDSSQNVIFISVS